MICHSRAKKDYYHTDHLGSVQVVIDKDGQVVYKSEYSAFNAQADKTAAGESTESHGFTGKEFDPDVGLYYFNARWYDPDLGRFISEDPVADPASPNLYTYCGNNPLNRLDPTGQFWWLVAIAAIRGGIQVAENGGSFLNGFVQAGVMALINQGIGQFVQGLSWSGALGEAAKSAVSSAICAAINGENPLTAVSVGLIQSKISQAYKSRNIEGGLGNHLLKLDPKGMTKYIETILPQLNSGLNISAIHACYINLKVPTPPPPTIFGPDGEPTSGGDDPLIKGGCL